jgi:hypothetical protein
VGGGISSPGTPRNGMRSRPTLPSDAEVQVVPVRTHGDGALDFLRRHPGGAMQALGAGEVEVASSIETICTMGVKWSNCWPISNESPRGKDDGDALDDRCESF